MNQELLNRLGTLRSQEDTINLGYIPTGSYALNYIVSGKYSGGFPIGRLIEIYGESSTGKTAILTHVIREAQKLGYFTGLLDNEFSYNPELAETLGVDNSKLVFATPDTVVGCFKKAQEWIDEFRKEDKDTPMLICLDSLAGQSSVESEKDIGDFSPTDGPRRSLEIGQCLRMLKPELMKSKVCFIVINQTRVNINVTYGDKTAKSGGGAALAFWCDTSLLTLSNKTSDILRIDTKPIGIKGVIRSKKAKGTIPFRECEFRLDFDKGLNSMYGLLPLLAMDGTIEKNGGWYTLKSTGAKFQESSFHNGEVKIEELDKILGIEV